jgi:signal transduction histidine kinase
MTGVQLEVSDSGPGIDPELLPHVFDRFYRSDPSRSSPGAGLGLSIAKAIVEDHGGSIGIASESEAGTIVNVTLPNRVDMKLNALTANANQRAIL